MTGQSQGQQADNSLAPLWIMILVFIVLGLIWYFFSAQIIKTIFDYKAWQIDLIGKVIGGVQNSPTLLRLQKFIHEVNPANVSFSTLLAVCEVVGDYLRYPFAALILGLGIVLILRSDSFRFRSRYNMKTLFRAELKIWPQITPIANLNLVKQDIDEGPWAMSLQPMAFAKKHQLLKEERKSITDGMLLRDQRPTVSVIKGAAFRVFALQLGKPWQGLKPLPEHIKALFAAFAAKGNGDDKVARKLLLTIAESTARGGKLNYQGTEHLLAKYADTKPVKKILEQHGYVFTVMMSMLEFARQDGVFASADFLWLKPIDRTLWYALNMVGRQTPLPEVAGIFSHWVNEKEIGHALKTPMVEEAVNALELAIKEVIYIPDEEK
ncbi:MAG: type IVB secretion system coupling complex protein DotM/IcmP [Legionellales bacterium]|nr:type IVB secretion system coupling complex protein DotM/IcmP [Legionellales bacterium]